MLGWLYRVLIGNFTGCKHQWEDYEQYSKTSGRTGRSIGFMYVLKCKHCGDLKRKDFNLGG